MDPEIDVTDITGFNEKQTSIQTIKVVGVGGGGNNAVEKMFEAGIRGVSFVQINTDKQVLNASKVPNTVLLGKGLGAGGKPEVARKFAEESAEMIADVFDDNTNMVFVTAGMGGGTGTGAGPVVARIAREKGILTVGIVTIPFNFEGPGRTKKALAGADEMAKYVDALLVIDNDRLIDIYPDFSIFTAMERADDTLKNAAESITEIITIKGVINRDFNDVDATLRDGGTAIISSGYGEGPNRVADAIQNALRSPLLKDCDVMGSKRMLLVLYVSDDNKDVLQTGELEAITSFVGAVESDDIEVKWGLYPQPDLGNRVKVTILASGFETSTRGKDQPHQPEPTAKGTAEKPTGDIAVDKDIARTLAGYNIIQPDRYDDDESIRALNTQTPRSGSFHKNAAAPAAGKAAPSAADKGNGGNVISFDDM